MMKKKTLSAVLVLFSIFLLVAGYAIAQEDVAPVEQRTYALEILNQQNVGEKKGTLLFVHGVCHGAWAWTNFMDYFSERGYDCYALSLRGHAGSEGLEDLNLFSLDDYVQDVISALAPFDGNAIVIGHSMGGGIVQRLINEHPGHVSAAVLFASIPQTGMDEELVQGIIARSPEGTDVLVKQAMGEPLTIEELAQASFFGGRIPIGEIEEYAQYLQAESITAQGELYLPISQDYDRVEIPVSVIGSSNDLLFADREMLLLAGAYGVEAIILEDLCHDMMIDPEWEIAAEAVLGFLNQLPDEQ